MNKKEACTLAYELISSIDDIKDEEFKKDLLFAIVHKEEYTIAEMLEDAELEEENE